MDEIPRYVIVSDFARVALHDLEPEEQRDLPLFDRWRVSTIEFPLADFHKNIHVFAFIPGYKQHKFADQDPINIKAVGLMGNLHDALEAGGYTGHDLERFLVRVLFCLFAEDTGIFERDFFTLYLENRTAKDGSDLGPKLSRLFEVLNTGPERRQANLDEDLAAFPYVNGELFSERLGFADFNADMRNALLASTHFDWSRISPAVFGALFQAVMEPQERRQIGAHYTSEHDILKVIRSLFLDNLQADFERAKRESRPELQRFHDKMAKQKFLDPACGCGNFLVITYRELRLLELEVLKALHDPSQKTLDISILSRIDVDQFFGIEIEEWPARIAEVALWLMDHQMNQRLSEAFGQYYIRLPLRKSPHIVCANALRIDWRTVLQPEQCSFILGNPPFVGKHYRTDAQSDDLLAVHQGMKSASDLDFVTAWHRKAAEYIQGTRIDVAFVSTNSITQGEQVSLLWPFLFSHFGIKILFGHRTFKWESEARGKAHVHVVIIGFGAYDRPGKRIYDYEDGDGNKAHVTEVPNISPYLTAGSDTVVVKRRKPISPVPEMRCGNKPSDGGNLILDDREREHLLAEEPAAAKYLRKFIGSEEFINGGNRWCLWLVNAPPDELRKMPLVMERVEKVREFRLRSTAAPTREAANRAALFFYISQPETDFIVIPEVSSERRQYIPIAFVNHAIISANTNFLLPSSDLFLFGVLTSAMHMAWTRQVCGRLKSDYRYQRSLVYNTFLWPQDIKNKQRAAVEKAARAVLDARAEFKDATLADLYDPLTMPPVLVKAHTALDRAVDLCYRPQPFPSERSRIEHLFSLYEKLTAPLIRKKKKKTLGTLANTGSATGNIVTPAVEPEAWKASTHLRKSE